MSVDSIIRYYYYVYYYLPKDLNYLLNLFDKKYKNIFPDTNIDLLKTYFNQICLFVYEDRVNFVSGEPKDKNFYIISLRIILRANKNEEVLNQFFDDIILFFGREIYSH